VGTAGEQPRLDDEEHAAGGGVEREHPEVNRILGHGHGGEPDTADGGQCACGEYRPLVAEPLTAPRSRARGSPIGWVRTSWSMGSGRRASVRRTPLGRRDDELANAAEAAAVADAIG
jgi:hypothetical protein